MQDRRTYQRFDFDFPILAEFPKHQETRLRTCNISRGGICLVCENEAGFGAGPMGGIVYELDNRQPLRNFRFHGNIQYVRDNRLGVAFSWLSPLEKQELTRLMRGLQKRS